jgi:hypothetical protein
MINAWFNVVVGLSWEKLQREWLCVPKTFGHESLVELVYKSGVAR